MVHKKEVSYGAVIYNITDKKIFFLLVKSKCFNKWGFPKGHQKLEETDSETAKREIYEETGLSIVNFVSNFKEKEQYIIHRKEEQNNSSIIIKKCNVYFLAVADLKYNIKITDNCEILEARWCTINEAINILYFRSQKLILQEAYNFVLRRLSK
ncbi:MAG: NUDIX domain-containing protein [Endomicrobium sp.]|nr:NUDIX domain-containing protein [Endomicrobium sp.]